MQDPDRHIHQSIEALIFASEEAITYQTICQVTGFDLRYPDLEEIVDSLNREYEATGRTFRIHGLAGGFRFLSEPEYGDLIRKLLAPVIQRRLSRSMLEVLAVVAWHQPVTRGGDPADQGGQPGLCDRQAPRTQPHRGAREGGFPRQAVAVRDDQGVPRPVPPPLAESAAEASRDQGDPSGA